MLRIVVIYIAGIGNHSHHHFLLLINNQLCYSSC